MELSPEGVRNDERKKRAEKTDSAGGTVPEYVYVEVGDKASRKSYISQKDAERL